MGLKVFLRNSPDLVHYEYITQERAGEPEDVRCSQAFLRERAVAAGVDEGATKSSGEMFNRTSRSTHEREHIPPSDRGGGIDDTTEDDEPAAPAVGRNVEQLRVGHRARDDAALFVQGGGDGGGGGERADILESLVDELRLDVRLLRAGGVHRDA